MPRITNPTIAIDARMLGFSGIGTYLKNILENLAAIDNEFQFRIICQHPGLLSNLPASKFQLVRGRARIYSLAEQWEIARFARGADLLHCPHYNVPYFYSGRLVVTIHDLNHLAHPELLPNWFAHAYARLMYRAASRHALRIITDSQFSRQEILERLSVPCEKIRVVYLGLPEGYGRHDGDGTTSQLQKFGIRRPYILSVGLLKHHKNFQSLLRAFAALPSELRERYRLVIVGKRDAAYPDLVRITQERSLEGRVIFTDYVQDEDLQALYSSATLFVLISLSEGFGLPALEAMAHGVPVVVSNTSSLPEVVGTAGVLVNPRDEHAIAASMQELLMNDSLRGIVSERARQRAQLFSARQAALDHLEVYRAALAA